MKPFKAAYTFLLPVMMVLSTGSAMAESHSANDIANYYNSNRQLSSFEAPLKNQFKTQEDHRQIDKTISELEGKVDKWLWRFEVPQKDKLAFRVNGRVQWVMDIVDFQNKIFKLNGKKLEMKPGESFLAFQSKVTTLLQNKNALYDQLFFHEAHAFLPLLGFAAFTGAVVAATSGQAATKCLAQDNSVASFYSKKKGERKKHFRNGVICGNNIHTRKKVQNNMGPMPSDYQNRIEIVSNSYKRAFTDSTGGIALPARGDCISEYKNNGYNLSSAIRVCKCIHLLKKPCITGGWNMLPSMAANTCLVAYNHSQNRCAGPPQKSYPSKNSGGVYDDVPQVGKGGGYQRPSNPYDDVPTLDKGGEQQPTYQPVQQPDVRD